MKCRQKNLYSDAPTTSKRSRLDANVVANTDAVTLSDDHSDSGPQCPSEDSLVQIDDEDLHQNRSKWPSLAIICDCYQISGRAVANAVMKDLNS